MAVYIARQRKLIDSSTHDMTLFKELSACPSWFVGENALLGSQEEELTFIAFLDQMITNKVTNNSPETSEVRT